MPLPLPDGIMIKRVFPAEDSDQIKGASSYNSTDYPEFMIDRSDVRDVARITCVIVRLCALEPVTATMAVSDF